MAGRRLIRQIRAGESLSFDGGRVVVTLRQRTGQRAELSLHLEDDVVVDKPRTLATIADQTAGGSALAATGANPTRILKKLF